MILPMKRKLILVETLVTLVHDNLTNCLLVLIAIYFFGIKLEATLALWGIGQGINFGFSYARRLIFQRYY